MLWDGDNLFFSTDGQRPDLGGTDDNYGSTRGAIAIAGTVPRRGTDLGDESSSGYPAGVTPIVMFYHDETSLAVSTEALAQLGEVTFRDPYLTHFITDPAQTFPLTNYDVSFVNNMVAPAAMEATNVPIYNGPLNEAHLLRPARATAGPAATATRRVREPDQQLRQQPGRPPASGKYFGGKGWPEYYNPDPTPTTYNIPSGFNLFSDSPLNTKGNHPIHLSGFDSNHWNLPAPATPRSRPAGPASASRARCSSTPDRIYLTNPTVPSFATDISQMLAAGPSTSHYPGPNPDRAGQVTSSSRPRRQPLRRSGRRPSPPPALPAACSSSPGRPPTTRSPTSPTSGTPGPDTTSSSSRISPERPSRA